jgi:hypothetical protein
VYLLDANVFIEAKKEYYRFENFQGFWDLLDAEQAKGTLASIWSVAGELLDGDDILVTWAKDREPRGWFLPVDERTTQLKFTTIADWVMNHPRYSLPSQTKFLEGSDPWVIAKAAVVGATVVTLEKFESDVNCRHVKIPNVCRAFNVQYLDTFDMLQQLNVKFVLG